MDHSNAAVAVFSDHGAAETAVKKLTAAGFNMKQLSVVGKGYHTEEKVVGFYNVGDRVAFGAHAAPSGAASGRCSSAACSLPRRWSDRWSPSAISPPQPSPLLRGPRSWAA